RSWRQRVEPAKHGARIRASAAEASANGNALDDLDRESSGPTGRVLINDCRSKGEISLDRSESTRRHRRSRHVQRATWRLADANIVAELEAKHDRLERVIAARLSRENAQEKIPLRVRGHTCRATHAASALACVTSPILNPSRVA